MVKVDMKAKELFETLFSKKMFTRIGPLTHINYQLVNNQIYIDTINGPKLYNYTKIYGNKATKKRVQASHDLLTQLNQQW